MSRAEGSEVVLVTEERPSVVIDEFRVPVVDGVALDEAAMRLVTASRLLNRPGSTGGRPVDVTAELRVRFEQARRVYVGMVQKVIDSGLMGPSEIAQVSMVDRGQLTKWRQQVAREERARRAAEQS